MEINLTVTVSIDRRLENMSKKSRQVRVGYFLSGLDAFLLHLPQIYHRGK